MSPAFLSQRWKPGQSGNPSGQAAEYGEVVRLARSLSIRAVERIGELIESDDERIAAMTCNAIFDRAFGKSPQQRREEAGSLEERYRQMTPEEREADAVALADDVKRLLARRPQVRSRVTRPSLSPRQQDHLRSEKPVRRGVDRRKGWGS